MNAVQKLWFTPDRLFIETADGQTRSQPMRFYPRLQQATERQRAEWTQSHFGLHWETIGEDVSFESFTWGDNDPQTLYSRG